MHQRHPDRFWPAYLPGARRFLLTVQTDEGAWIHVASLETRTMKRIARGASRSEYVSPGWLAWCEAGRLLVQAFDADTHEVAGSPRQLVEGVWGFLSRGAAFFSFSDEGTLVYRKVSGKSDLERVARGGRTLAQVAEADDYDDSLRLDRAGRRLAVAIKNETGSQDLWIRDLERGVSTRATSHERWADAPRWSPDGTRIAFLAD